MTALGRVGHDRLPIGTGDPLVVDGQPKCGENASKRVRQDQNHEARVGHFGKRKKIAVGHIARVGQ